MVRGWLVVGLTAWVGLAAEAPVSAADDAQSGVMLPWGVPAYTEGAQNTWPRPSWILSTVKSGGSWITNDSWYGWQPALSDWYAGLATNCLFIQLDRTLLTNNLGIAVAGSAETNATLLAGYLDTQLMRVGDPVELQVAAASGVAWAAMSNFAWYTNTLDLPRHPAASIIALSTSNGLMRIYSTALYQNGVARPSMPEPVAAALPATAGKVTGSPAASVSLPIGTYSISAAAPPVRASIAPVSNMPNAQPVLSKGPRTWHVNAATGDDVGRDGTAKVCEPNAPAGPKRTIAAALKRATPGDTVVVAAGTYAGHVPLDGIRLITHGRVVLP
jgi:hypothetical protein